MKKQKKALSVTSLVSSGLLLAASAASAGHYYETVTEGRSEGQRKGHHMKVRGWVDGDRARVEFASGEKDGWFADGNYIVTTDGAATSYLVNPKKEEYTKFSLSDLMSAVGQSMNVLEELGDMVKVEFTDLSSEKLLEEPGESLHGYATTHYRYKNEYTMKMNMMGMKRQNRTESVTDIWSTDEFDSTGFGVWLGKDAVGKTGNEELDKLWEQEMVSFKGLPLKIASETTNTNKKGKTQKTTSTTNVTVLREESVDDVSFDWPAHYTETELIPEVDMEALKSNQGNKKGKKKKD